MDYLVSDSLFETETDKTSNTSKTFTRLLGEIKQINKEDRDIMNSFSWALESLETFLIISGLKPSISNLNAIVCKSWLKHLESKGFSADSILMRIVVISYFFDTLHKQNVIHGNPMKVLKAEMDFYMKEYK